MHRILRALTTAALLLLPAEAAPQSVLETVWSDARAVPFDLFYVWTGPARLDADDVPPLVLFAGGTAVLALNDLAIQEWVRAHPRSAPIIVLEPFRDEHDALSRLGQNHWILRGAGVGYVVGLAARQDWLREASLGCAVGNTANALPRKAVYGLIARRRPEGQDDPYQFDVPGGDWDLHSFFGGHAANAFSCASFIAHRWDLGWAEPAVWALATGVAAARTADEAHWASDTLVGGAFGFAIGRMIAHRHLERARDRDDQGDDGVGDDADEDARRSRDARRAVRVEALGATPARSAGGDVVLLVGGRIVF